MTGEHFKEYLYTILLTSKSDKKDICRYLNISKVTLNNYLRYGLPEAKRFLIVDRLEGYLFEKLGGFENGTFLKTV